MTADYVCGVCRLPIVDEDPHTDPATGEDVHEDCCPVCRPTVEEFLAQDDDL
jgi:hypothetical protein